MGGYIKLFRKMIDWEWYKDVKTKAVFLHILLTANYGYQRYQGREISRGQLLTSVRRIAEETGLSQREVRTALEHLKATNSIRVEATNKATLITVEKWDFYQVDEGDLDKLLPNPFDKQPTNQH